MEEHRRFWLVAIGAVCCVGAVIILVPDLFAERFANSAGGAVNSPLDADAVRQVDRQLNVPGVTAQARRARVEATAAGRAKMYVVGEVDAFGRAKEAFTKRQYTRCERLLRALISHRTAALADRPDESSPPGESPNEVRDELDQSRLLLAHLLARTDRPAQSAQVLAKVSAQTPVDDFIDWLRGRALLEAGQPASAARAFASAEQADTTLVKLRARVQRARALAEAKRWKQALPLLEAAVQDLPDYPRRAQLLLDRGHALEALDRPDQAVRAYQQAWFEYPHKSPGKQARQQMSRLAESGHSAPEISPSRRYARYRKLRINKHWALAETLFSNLLEQTRSRDGSASFEHDILFQLALNDYVPQHYKQALGWLKKLRNTYQAGHTAGIDPHAIYDYLGRTYSRLNQFDHAEAALEHELDGRSQYARRRERAEFYQEHGRYERARKLYAQYYSKWRKRDWKYTWLLYKTGDFQQAYKNLTRLAERSGGRRRAKYMYWAARTLDRGGSLDEAMAVYTDVASAYEMGYYGIQARNRILDIRQRKSVDGAVIAQTHDLVHESTKALAALDQAGDALAGAPAALAGDPPYRNPRLVPRTADGSSAAATTVADRSSPVGCRADNRPDESFCEMMTGQPADDSQRTLAMALAPMGSYSGLLPGLAIGPSSETAEDVLGDDHDEGVELGESAGSDAPAPPRDVQVDKRSGQAPRIAYNTDARIYWEGRSDSTIAFIKAADGDVLGPLPDHPWAYDQRDYHDGLARAVASAGDLFPQLVRAKWLREAGYTKYARWAMRDAALEYRGLSRRGRPYSKPHDLPYKRWAYLIDNRRHETGLWGYDSDEARYPVPDSSSAKAALLKRQKEIYQRRDELKGLMLAAMKDVGDYHLVRRFTLGAGPWYRKDPQGPTRGKWMQAYPRAFPRRVLRASAKNGLNPYLVWALMTVESSYNPDSISPADALGLLQVIPRTGIKTAEMLGDDDFGPMDLLDEDVAIKHGAFYFSKLVDKFHGQELLAIAGYNGGPHRVAAWLDKRGKNMPMDEFVEEIPFNQARNYTKKVLRFLALYLRIYEGVDQLYIGQNMRLDYLDEPNF